MVENILLISKEEFKIWLNELCNSGLCVLYSFIISTLLNIKIPLFHKYVPSLRNFLAFSKLGFSLNSKTLVICSSVRLIFIYPYPVWGSVGVIPKVMRLFFLSNSENAVLHVFINSVSFSIRWSAGQTIILELGFFLWIV